MNWLFGYCTNVLAGETLEQTCRGLRSFGRHVLKQLGRQEPLRVGLWLSARSADELRSARALAQLAELLTECQLIPFTLNGFPYGNFHQSVVKYEVYRPDWLDGQRQEYTLRLIEILNFLLPPGDSGTISTLPLAWGSPPLAADQLSAAGTAIWNVVARLEALEQKTGRLIALCIEPEPGCALATSTDVVRFFEYLSSQYDADAVHRYLRVCHDVCHASVMFESQAGLLKRYQGAGIRLGKVQIASSLRVDFSACQPADRSELWQQLAGFAEDRYLHQTAILAPPAEPQLYDDLPLAMNQVSDPAELSGEWRIHFHLPIDTMRLNGLGTSQSDILACLESLDTYDPPPLEIETYAWGVLPPEHRGEDLWSGVARELQWLESQLQQLKQGRV